MIKKVGKLLPFALAGAITVSSLSGCGTNTKTVDTSSIEYTVSNSIGENSIEKVEETTEPEIIEDTQEEIKEEKELTVESLCSGFKEQGVPEDTIKEELENIAMLGSYQICEFRTYQRVLYPHLASTLEDGESIYDKYYKLAMMEHLLNCPDVHISEDGYMYCKSMEFNIDDINNTILFDGYFVEDIIYSDEESLIKPLMRIYNNIDVDLIKALEQLENVYLARIIPRCMDEEEWNLLFSELLKTCSEYENVCDVYGELATLRHMYLCENEHYENEFGVTECEPAKKKVLGN